MDPVIRKQVIPLWIGTAIGLLIVSPLFAVLDPSYWVGASVGILIAAVISTSLQIRRARKSARTEGSSEQ